MIVAVYGTLRKDQPNFHLIENAKEIGQDIINGIKMFAYSTGFPACISTEDPNDKVVVELYEVDQTTLNNLDRLEGHPRWYLRTPVRTQKEIECEIYLMSIQQVEGTPLIKSGDWLKWKLSV